MEMIDSFWYWFIPMCIIIFGYLYYDTFGADKCKPKYRLDKNGYLQFYYRRYSLWIDFPIWKDNNDTRQVEVHDRVRDIDYTLTYVGPGRCKIKIPCTDPKKYSSKDIKKRFPSYKHTKEIWKKYCLYVDKENIILNDIIKNHKFKAYESNS